MKRNAVYPMHTLRLLMAATYIFIRSSSSVGGGGGGDGIHIGGGMVTQMATIQNAIEKDGRCRLSCLCKMLKRANSPSGSRNFRAICANTFYSQATKRTTIFECSTRYSNQRLRRTRVHMSWNATFSLVSRRAHSSNGWQIVCASSMYYVHVMVVEGRMFNLPARKSRMKIMTCLNGLLDVKMQNEHSDDMLEHQKYIKRIARVQARLILSKAFAQCLLVGGRQFDGRCQTHKQLRDGWWAIMQLSIFYSDTRGMSPNKYHIKDLRTGGAQSSMFTKYSFSFQCSLLTNPSPPMNERRKKKQNHRSVACTPNVTTTNAGRCECIQLSPPTTPQPPRLF